MEAKIYEVKIGLPRNWIPRLEGVELERARSAFNEISDNEVFQIVVAKIYLDHGPVPKWLDPDLFVKILVQDLLEEFDATRRGGASAEIKEAIKQAKKLVSSAANDWNESRAYACTLLVSLTLRKMVANESIVLEIEDGGRYIS